MPDRRSLQQLTEIVSLRDAQTKAAASAFREALEESAAAAIVLKQSQAEHEEALARWLELVNSDRPDPQFATLQGRWLVSRQQELQAEHLNCSITEQRQDRARDEYSTALALTAAAKKISAQVQSSMAKKHIEQHSAILADAWLWRRG